MEYAIVFGDVYTPRCVWFDSGENVKKIVRYKGEGTSEGERYFIEVDS